MQDTQRLVDPAREVARELDDAGNGGAGVDKSKAAVVLTAAVREYGRIVAATEQAPDRDRVMFGTRLRDQLVRVAFDKLLRMQLYRVCFLICQRSSGRRMTLGNTERSSKGAKCDTRGALKLCRPTPPVCGSAGQPRREFQKGRSRFSRQVGQ